MVPWITLASVQEENVLQNSCSKGDITSCEHLTALFIKRSQWNNAIVLGDTLCKKDSMKGCTFAGTALLSKERVKEGLIYLTKACDGLEPYACRSLSRIMKKNKEALSSYMFSKRACYYGLTEMCKTLKTPKETYSAKGIEFFKGMIADCEDSTSPLCKSRLEKLNDCRNILTENDCVLMPGDLSIYFRAKLIQESAKLNLQKMVESQNLLKENQKLKRFSYDLGMVFKYESVNSNVFVYGFQKACTKKYEKSNAESTTLGLFKQTYADLSTRVKTNIASFFYKGKAEDCYDPRYGYEVFAVGNLDPLNPPKLDIWKINGDGNILHVQDGLPVPL